MTVILPPDLPAIRLLRADGVAARTDAAGDARSPLRVALVNLMPDKQAAEVQIARMLAGAARAVELTLIVPGSDRPTQTPAAHLSAFYRPWAEVRGERFDGVVITGAPVETLPFERVAYWEELRRILDWAATTARSTLCLCWAAEAALRHFHGVPKHLLPQKTFGIFRQRVEARDDPLLTGIEDGFAVPVARHAEIRAEDLAPWMGVRILASCAQTGPGLMRDPANRMVLQLNCPEYDAESLGIEWRRDRIAGLAPPMPANYFPLDDPSRAPRPYWRPAAQALYRNWVAELEPRDAAEGGRTRWLTGRAGLAEDGSGDLRVTLADPVLGINRVLEALGRMDVPCISIRRDGRDVLARVDGIAPMHADRLVKRLRAALDAACVAYRADGGMAGALAVAPGGDTPPEAQAVTAVA